jgi:hypothetical protein
MAAPVSSSVFPNRPIGARIKSSCARGVLSRSCASRSVRKTPGAMALIGTPRLDHSTASERVSDTTPALLAAYAATSLSATKLLRDAMLWTKQPPTWPLV